MRQESREKRKEFRVEILVLALLRMLGKFQVLDCNRRKSGHTSDIMEGKRGEEELPSVRPYTETCWVHRFPITQNESKFLFEKLLFIKV
jgi:hypothetical protein